MGSALLLLSVLVPLVGSLLLPLVSRYTPKARNALALAFTVLSACASGVLLCWVAREGEITLRYPLALHFDVIFHADYLAVFMALISSIIGSIIVYYSTEYIAHYQHQDEYYFMVVLFLGAMIGLVYSGSLLYMYLFWEISAVCCWRLIGFFRGAEQVERANKAFLITVFGAVAMLLGFITVYFDTGTWDMTKSHGLTLGNLSVVLILLGILSKSATFPLHTWLPDAGVAPSPVTALLHAAVLVKIGVYAFARIFCATYLVPEIWHTAVPVIAAVSALVSAGAALVDTDMKRIIAYSTVSQLSFILLGLSIGTPLGVAGGLLYILMHGIAKAGLFLCAGIVEHNAHTKDIRELGGLVRSMPLTALSFALCALSVMGIPPFGGFFAKFYVIAGAVDAGQVWLSGVFILGACLTVLYLCRVGARVFLGEQGQGLHGVRESIGPMLISVIILAFLSLASGLLVSQPFQLIHSAIKQMGGNL